MQNFIFLIIIEPFSIVLALFVLISLLVMLSDKIKVAYPILLVLAGLALCFIPNTPQVKIDPNLIFIIFLPPLLYEAAWANSWKEIYKWRRIIGSFAFIVVFLTAVAVAFVTNWLIPGFPLVLGFLLGGVVSPPDAVSAGAILKFVKVPKRIATILEGESLFNDASSLIIMRFALIAVTTGQFIWQQAMTSFAWMIFGGIGIGILIAFVFSFAHKRLPTNANIDVIFTLVAPYIMYIAAEELHASGVMSVVCGGLYLSNVQYSFLDSSSRIQGIAVWKSFTFLLNGMVFLLIGLDMPEIMTGLRTDGIDFWKATGYGLIVTAVLIIGRLFAAYGAVFVTKIMSNFITVADTRTDFKAPAVVGWAGMRGVVSLAAALSIPLTLEDGSAFPFRSLILYITFVVILVTLVFQGLTLPYLIKVLKLKDYNDHISERETEKIIFQTIRKASEEFLKSTPDERCQNPQLKRIADFWLKDMEEECETERLISEETKEIYSELIEYQRSALVRLNKERKDIEEELIREYIYRLDLTEQRMR